MFKTISIHDTHQMLAKKNVQIVDIRDQGSFDHGRIPGAQLVNHQNLQEFIEAADFDSPTLVYCHHGISSQPAAQLLEEKGFENVYSLDGGFDAWKTQYEIES